MEPEVYLDHVSAEHVAVRINNRTGNAVLTFEQPVENEEAEAIAEHLSTHISGVRAVGVHEKYLVLIGGPWAMDRFFRHVQDVFSGNFWPIQLVTDHRKAA